MDRTTRHICLLIKAIAAHTGRAESTVSRLATGSGDTLRRLEATREDGTQKHRISTERAHRAMVSLAEMFPHDLEWPRDVPRPQARKRRLAA